MARPPSIAAILNGQKIAEARFTFKCQKCKSDDINYRGTGKARCLQCRHEWHWQPVSARESDVGVLPRAAPPLVERTISPAQLTMERKPEHQPSSTAERLEKAQRVRDWLDQLPDQPEDYEPMIITNTDATLVIPKRRKRTDEEDEQRSENSASNVVPSSPPTLDTSAPIKRHPSPPSQSFLLSPASNPQSPASTSASVQRFSFNTTPKKASPPTQQRQSLDTSNKATSALDITKGVPTSSRPSLAYLQPNILHPKATAEITKFPLRSKLNHLHAPRVPSPLTTDVKPTTPTTTTIDENNGSQQQQSSLTELSARIRQQRAALFLRTGASLR
ncbi:hypothetical protein [Absidia glauca]|uniref:Uncharacterized protein n=1 Tax=Absidia glauca TaxID=4829 RepID=A0A168SUB7_ABSGL|nr:hypothetical protein [Absidia glauca]